MSMTAPDTAVEPAPVATSQDDERFMRLALELGRRGLGNTWPNPAVGAVIVKDGVIVGRGWTQPGGRPHAETQALKRAGEAAQGATLYTSLEPCSHTGKTPSMRRRDRASRRCARRLRAGRSEPGSRGAGPQKADRQKASASISACWRKRRGALMPGTLRRITDGRPHVMLKLAISSDGKAGLGGRRPIQLTGEVAHRIRVPHARPGGRHPGRHRHGACRQSGAELPAARHVRALASTRFARLHAQSAAGERT